MIPKDQCKHGYTYRIHSRNLTVGVYNEKDGGFVGIREKFGDRFLFPEFHHDNGAPYGTVKPVREIEKCPIEDQRAHLDDLCGNCQKRVDWKKTDEKKGTGVWYHLEEGDCKEASPYAPRNKPLFEYLEKVEKVVDREILVEECEDMLKRGQFSPWELVWNFRRAVNAGVVKSEVIKERYGVDVAEHADVKLSKETVQAATEWLLETAKS